MRKPRIAVIHNGTKKDMRQAQRDLRKAAGIVMNRIAWIPSACPGRSWTVLYSQILQAAVDLGLEIKPLKGK